jgi:hypothetical protein
MSVSLSLSLKLAEFSTEWDDIWRNNCRIFSQNSHLEYKYRAIDLGTCYPRLGTLHSRLGTCYPRHFLWTRAIFTGPTPFLLTRHPRHIGYSKFALRTYGLHVFRRLSKTQNGHEKSDVHVCLSCKIASDIMNVST